MKKSIETRSWTWLVRNVRQVCDGRCAPLGDQAGDRALGYFNPELQEFPMDSGRAPQRIGGGHFADEGDDLGVDWRAAYGGPAGELGPVLAEATPLPTQRPCRESRTRGTASTRPRPWSARPRTGGPPCAAWAGRPFACTRRAGGARRGSRGRAGGGRRRGRGGAEAGGAGG